MRYRYLLLCLAFAAPAASANELMKVYDLAVQNDPAIQAAAHARDAGIEAKPLARASLLPQLNAGYQKGRSETEATGPACDQTVDPPVCAIVTTDSTVDTDGYGITLSQAIFNWEAIQALRQSGNQVALAETTYRAAQQSLALRVADAYFGVLSANDNLRSTEAENKALERQLEQAKKRFEVGLSAITDVQEAQARYDLTVASLISAQQALESAKDGLATITGQRSDNFVALQKDIPLPAPDPSDVNVWVSAARDNNLDLLSAKLVAEIAKGGVNVAQARHFPTIGAQAQYQDGTQGDRFGGADITQTSVVVELSVPLFAGGATQSRVRSAVATHEQRLAEHEATKRAVEKQARDAYQGVVAGAAAVKAYKQAVVSSTTALEASETGLQVGARTAVDVLNAQQQLYSALRVYAQSRYDYLLNVLKLKAAAGRLGVQDLAEIDRLLVQ